MTDWNILRERMVAEQIASRGIKDPDVLRAISKVPRHLFVPEQLRDHAYEDKPVYLDYGQTISQPYIVALMTEHANINSFSRVLEIGTGSGYQAAVLAEIAGVVFSIEIICDLACSARETFDKLGFRNIINKCGDAYTGWDRAAPFDAIIVTAAPNHIPNSLTDQLTIGGRLIIPVGNEYQELIKITRTENGLERETITPVRFVPMTGEALDSKIKSFFAQTAIRSLKGANIRAS